MSQPPPQDPHSQPPSVRPKVSPIIPLDYETPAPRKQRSVWLVALLIILKAVAIMLLLLLGLSLLAWGLCWAMLPH